jgi:hypothetical protein
LPGLTRQSIFFAKIALRRMDPQVKPAGDAGGWASSDLQMTGTRI